MTDVLPAPELELLDELEEDRWRTYAACRGLAVSLFFAEKGDADTIRAARETCAACPVAPACLEEAILNEPGWGVWAGTTVRERQRLRRETPSPDDHAARLLPSHPRRSVPRVDAVDVVTLVIAIFGAVTGAASLGWSIASHFLSGGRVNVELRGGWVGPGNLITAPLTRKGVWPDPNFVNEPVLAVQASNVGRLPVSVEGWAVKIGEISLGHVDHPANAPVPKLLGVGESATWIIPVQSILAGAHAARETGLKYKELRATVSLGSGKARTTKPSTVSSTDIAAVFGIG